MKKLLYLLIILLFISCINENDDETDPLLKPFDEVMLNHEVARDFMKYNRTYHLNINYKIENIKNLGKYKQYQNSIERATMQIEYIQNRIDEGYEDGFNGMHWDLEKWEISCEEMIELYQKDIDDYTEILRRAEEKFTEVNHLVVFEVPDYNVIDKYYFFFNSDYQIYFY